VVTDDHVEQEDFAFDEIGGMDEEMNDEEKVDYLLQKHLDIIREEEEEEENEDDSSADEEESKKGSKGKNKKVRSRSFLLFSFFSQAFKESADYGASRGIDFQQVQVVFNLSTPTSPTVYTHRVGRTARANKKGTSLTFVLPREEQYFQLILSDQEDQGNTIAPYKVNTEAINGFEYRCEDGMNRALDPHAIREARKNMFRTEILNSQKLREYWLHHPEDLEELKHTIKPLQYSSSFKGISRVAISLPDYLLPDDTENKSGLKKLDDNKKNNSVVNT